MRFSNKIEHDFISEYHQDNLSTLRSGIIVGIGLFVLLGISDLYYLEHHIGAAIIIRFAIVVPVLVGVSMLLNHAFFRKNMSILGFSLAILGSLMQNLLALFSYVEGSNVLIFIGGISLIHLWALFALGLNYKQAIYFTVVSLLLFSMNSFLFNNIESPYYYFIFVGLVSIFGIYGNYQIEYHARLTYTQKSRLMSEKRKIQQTIKDFRKEKALLEKEKLYAQQNDALKLAFIANMSHEIRTPMNGILGFLELLNDEDLDEDERLYFTEVISNSGEKLLEIINDIIDVSRISFDQIKVTKSAFSLNEMLDDLMGYFIHDNLEYDSDVELVAQKELEDIDSMIITDKFRLKQIFINLIGNSLKYTENGQVIFGYQTLNNNVLKCYVKDTGIGIDPQINKHLFEPFKQGDDSLDRKYGGTGLGLTLTKHFVEILEGELWYESKIGKGTQFFFTIPIGIQHTNSDNLMPKKNTRNRKGHKDNVKIFVIEDDENSALYFQKLLEKTYANVVLFDNAEAAIEQIKHHPTSAPDIILMDYQLPKINGIEATRIIKALNPKIPIIVQSAFAMNNEKDQALRAGANDFLTKPVNYNKLSITIKKHLKITALTQS